jgi:hypothetical protein
MMALDGPAICCCYTATELWASLDDGRPGCEQIALLLPQGNEGV